MKLNNFLLCVVALNFLPMGASNAADKPNILWIFQEDTSPWMGCYGDAINKDWTPRIDKMAASGVRFSRAFVPFPVCSPCRSSMALGANAIRFGAHEHRSRRGSEKTYLPKGMKTIAELMRESNYFTFNIGKTDYNFAEAGNGIYSKVSKQNNKTPWRERATGQKFFGQIQLKGGKTNTRNWPAAKKTDPSSVTVPADYPQNDLYHEVVAQHYDAIRSDDQVIGGILDRLESDGLLESTIVVYFSDHGANNLIRHKQMPTEGGLHVPFIIQGPEKWVPNKGSVRDDLVDMLDLTATSFAWAGIAIPDWCEGQDLFAKNFKPRTFVGSAKDRLDHTIDRVRSIRTDRFRYTRNFFLDRVFLQPQYRDPRPFLKSVREAYADGTLAPKLAEIYFGERPAEELYDVVKDPAQVKNLATDPKFTKILKEHRAILDAWLADGGDLGAANEPDEELRMNGEETKWGIGVNAEYERIRQDKDGDGLSDTWEEQNQRDPHDGRLLFTFDCGGWQTEGWEAQGEVTNIAGYQGYLDFELLTGNASLVRDGLKLDTAKNIGSLVICIRSNADTRVAVSANGKKLGGVNVVAGADYNDYRLPLKEGVWKGVIKDLKLDFTAKNGATVAIDWIRVDE